MAVDWTPHRFAGGWLALDLANTVVHRLKPEQRFDRFDDAAEMARFAEAASGLRGDEWEDPCFVVPDPAAARPRILALREATDRLFRRSAGGAALSEADLPAWLRAAADAIDVAPPAAPGAVPLEAAAARSGLALLGEARWRRIRVCPNCDWLFLDKSRNGSRLWCDMAVCGNRAKARRHRRRHAQGGFA